MHLLIPAAGMGRRMGSDRNKLLLKLLGKPLLAWSLLAAENSKTIAWIGIMGQSEDFVDFKNILQQLNLTKPVQLIVGGDTRTGFTSRCQTSINSRWSEVFGDFGTLRSV
jgi:2-C-methyl-D-erythritol 4-phosphate cytidylyltransferase